MIGMKRELTINEKDMLIKGLTMIKNEKEAMIKNISKTNAVIGGAIGSAVASIGSALSSSTPTVVSAGLTGAVGTSVLPLAAVAVGGVAIVGGFLLGRKMGKKECLTKDEQIEQITNKIDDLQRIIEEKVVFNDSLMRHQLEIIYKISNAANISVYVLINSTDIPKVLDQLNLIKGKSEDDINEKYTKLSNTYNLDNANYEDNLLKLWATMYIWLYKEKRFDFDEVKRLTYKNIIDYLFNMLYQN